MWKKILTLFLFLIIPTGKGFLQAASPHMYRNIPKAELHLHLGGSYPLDYVLSLATPAQKEALEKGLKKIAEGIPYNDCFFIFGLISQIVNTEERVEKGTEALCRAMKEDGIVYAEIRTGIKDLGQGQEKYLQAVLRGIEREISDTFHVRLLLSLQRSSSIDYVKKTIDLALRYRDKGIVGLDISGDSTVGQIESLVPELMRAKENGLFLTLHIGESPLEKNQRWVLEELKPHRIGHGVHLDPAALEWVLQNKVPIEVCLSSSKCVQMIGPKDEHPGFSHYLKEHPIAICTDDPLLFSTTLSDEFALLENSLPMEKIKELARSAMDYAFLSEEEKHHLRELFVTTLP